MNNIVTIMPNYQGKFLYQLEFLKEQIHLQLYNESITK